MKYATIVAIVSVVAVLCASCGAEVAPRIFLAAGAGVLLGFGKKLPVWAIRVAYITLVLSVTSGPSLVDGSLAGFIGLVVAVLVYVLFVRSGGDPENPNL